MGQRGRVVGGKEVVTKEMHVGRLRSQRGGLGQIRTILTLLEYSFRDLMRQLHRLSKQLLYRIR